MQPEHAHEICKHAALRPELARRAVDNRFKLIIGNQEEKIALVVGIEKNRTHADVRRLGDLTNGRVVEASQREKFSGRILDAAELLDLVTLAQSGLRGGIGRIQGNSSCQTIPR